MNRTALTVISVLALLMLAVQCTSRERQAEEEQEFTSEALVSDGTRVCLQCHAALQPEIVVSWEESPHAPAGTGCYECHHAEPDEPGSVEHFGVAFISEQVSVFDCSGCHAGALHVLPELPR